MLKWFRFEFKDFVIILLVLLVFFKGRYKIPEPQIVRTTDTVYNYHTDTIRSVPVITQQIFPTQIETRYLPDTSYQGLRKQYEDLVRVHTTKNISQDSVKIDTIGWAAVRDTVTENKIVGRSWSYKIKEREVTNTITIREPYKPKTQLYYGGEVGIGNGIPSAGVGLMLKNKQDNVLKLVGEYIFPLKTFNAKVGYYQKLHL